MILYKSCIVFLFVLDRKSTRLNSSHANISYAVYDDDSIVYQPVSYTHLTSLIVTANYSLTEWLAIPGEEAVAAALLDRLLYRCEIIQLEY